MTLDNTFKTRAVLDRLAAPTTASTAMGHQESKLLRRGHEGGRDRRPGRRLVGVTRAAEQAAFAFARKLTLRAAPPLATPTSMRCAKHYNGLQILEMILSIGRQQRDQPLEGGRRRAAVSKRGRPFEKSRRPHAPAGNVSHTHEPGVPGGPVTGRPHCSRRIRESHSRHDLRTAAAGIARTGRAVLADCRDRASRLPLVDAATARTVLAENAPAGKLPNWMLLLANFPRDGARQVSSIIGQESRGDLSPLLRAQLSWIAARYDRAWYATRDAQRRLRELGQTDDQIFALDGDWSEFTPRERSLFVFTQNLAASPVVLTDAQVADAVALAGPREVVQAAHYVSQRSSFNRITEAAGLPIEP